MWKNSLSLRVAAPTVLVSGLLLAFCIAAVVFLYVQQAESARTLGENVSSAQNAHDLENTLYDLVTLLPLGADAVAVTTAGLAYPLKGETLHLGRSRGLSNRRTAVPAVVQLTAGRLLVVETPATL